MSWNWDDYTQGALGAIIGSVITVLGFRGRLDSIEKECEDLKKETIEMFREIREDIKQLIEKTAKRRDSN